MAYEAVISLKQTIHHLLNSSQTSLTSSNQEILSSTHTHLTSFQESLTKSDGRRRSNRLKALEAEIREAFHKLEDSLQNDAVPSPTLPLDIISFAGAYNQELNTPFSDDSITAPSQRIETNDVEMVGLCDVYTDFKDHLIRVIRPDDFGFFSFFGMPGGGRSILARSVYEEIYASFDCGAWVRTRTTSTYHLKQILLNIFDQINPIINHDEFFMNSYSDEEKLSEYLHRSLEGKRYIVGLEDLRDVNVLIGLRRSLPEKNNGSVVFVTTGSPEVAEFDESFVLFEMPTSVDESYIWMIIRLKFFGEDETISPEFEDIGRKIAKNCRGVRLVFARVLLLLRRTKKEAEKWRALESEHHSIYVVDDEITETNFIKRYMGDDVDHVWADNLFDFSILKERVMEILYPDRLFPKMGIMSVYGMAGVGKTTLMKKLFQDPSIRCRFNQFAWVDIGINYKSERILVDILAQLYPHIDRQEMDEDVTLVEDLCSQLSNKKCLIVLDDLWSQEVVHFLKMSLPNLRGELMVSTRLSRVANIGPLDRSRRLRLLNKEESWELLREKLFGEETCPYQLEIIGKKIAENCEGLPLLILKVAQKLTQLEKTLEHWTMVANRVDPLMTEAEYEVSKSLVTSYESLPHHLKACFLYMGVFPQCCEIPISKLIKLWFAEGFLEPNPSQTFEDFASRCLKELEDNSMVMVKKGSDLETSKICHLHPVFWHLSCNEAKKSKFFHILRNRDDDNLMRSMESQRRLCIPNNILLGIKDDDAMGAFSTIRALLCTGPPHQYLVPLWFGSGLLKVLEALTIRFYEFPAEVVEQIHLRYLSLTCDGDLPPSISKLWNLRFLIVKQYLSIGGSFHLPNEIWDLKELKHLEVSGNQLPDPECEALLPNLSSLLDVSVHSCTIRVFKGIPNLKKLGIRIELAPDDHNTNAYNCLDHVSHLSKLESLKCVVVNPDLGLEGVAPSIPTSILPSNLKKLSLSGLGYSWEYLSIIGKLQTLEVLKLQCYAFVGPSWEIDYHDFPELKSLSIEDSDLVNWDINMPSTQKLQFLSFKHCYTLQHLPPYLTVAVRNIEVVESHPSCENWAKQMKENNWERRLQSLEIDIQSSWHD